MVKATQKISKKSTPVKTTTKANEDSLFNMSLSTWIETASISFDAKKTFGKKNLLVPKVFLGQAKNLTFLNKFLSPKQIDVIKKSNQEIFEFNSRQGLIWLIQPATVSSTGLHRGLLRPSPATKLRDLFGQVLRNVLSHAPSNLEVIFTDASPEEIRQSLLGLELSSYKFVQEYFAKEKRLPKLHIFDLRLHKIKKGEAHPLLQKSLNKERLQNIAIEAKAMNMARHLVNLPPNILNPASYAQVVEQCFDHAPGISLEIWQDEKLKSEKMNLLRAVGQGSEFGPRLIHLKYRPVEAPSQVRQPIAFVGKGITFDSGGLDIKPSSGMRLMKKDMGGSAAVLGLCYWASQSAYPYPLDFYLAVAENSIDEKAFRPSDVLVARNGLSVEIHNTDAEGRLVLADALDVAVKQSGVNEPQAVINVATLTGAIKVGLGTEVAGLFCNNDILSELLVESGRQQNDLCWPMPLFQNYRNQLRSNFADMSNCSDSGFGGAISAALFLESFVDQKAWAHLDIFAWRDGVNGAYSESGGSGQSVLMLAAFLKRVAAAFDRGESPFN
jgi:leucyl aminopeptidase